MIEVGRMAAAMRLASELAREGIISDREVECTVSSLTRRSEDPVTVNGPPSKKRKRKLR